MKKIKAYRERAQRAWSDLTGDAGMQSLAYNQMRWHLCERIAQARAAGATRKEIAAFLGLSQSRVLQMEERAERRRRDHSPIERYMAENFNGPEPPDWGCCCDALRAEFAHSLHQWLRFAKDGGQAQIAADKDKRLAREKARIELLRDRIVRIEARMERRA